MLKLYHNDMSVCAQKVRMAMCFKGAQWESIHLNLRQADQFKPEFIKINPKSLVPVLEHDGQIILESSVIVEYLDDIMPEQPLFPGDAVTRSAARTWLIRLDANLHKEIAVISFCLAFRFQLLENYPDEQSLRAYIAKMPDPGRAAVLTDIAFNGTDSGLLRFAIYAYEGLLEDIATALAQRDWLVGEQLSAADMGFVPYLDRLEQLGLAAWWDDKPQIQQWLRRVRATEAYDQGIRAWHNENYLALMRKNATENWHTVNQLRP